MSMQEGNGGAYDLPDSRDFVALHLFGDPALELPSKVNIDDDVCHSQGTSMHCTAYSLTHCTEILKTLEHLMQAQCDPEEQWANQKYNRGGLESMEKDGDSLQNALKTLIKFGLNNKSPDIKTDKFIATGFAVIQNTVDDMKKWLARGYPIYTGSGDHCYCIVGYDDERKVFIRKNSYGKNWPAKNAGGTWELSYSDIGVLFTKYIIYLKQDMNHIFRDVTEQSPMADAIKWVLDKKIMVGYGTDEDPAQRFFKPDQPITRAELATVLFRLNN